LWNSEGRTPREAVELVVRTVRTIDIAERSVRSSLRVRYEDLVVEPAATLQAVCAFLAVEFDPGMLHDGSVDHGAFVYGLGD
jgi:hypothetical protein